MHYAKQIPPLALKWLGLFCLLCFAPAALAKTIHFGGYDWTVRSGHGGPGPNAWDEQNVWLDADGNLHLKISHRSGQWTCAELTLQQRLGFGDYRFQLTGPLDRLDDNVVLGLFNYPTREVGPDATHEIDIEFARWGDAKNPMGNFTVWPAVDGLRRETKSFAFKLTSDSTSHQFTWTRSQVQFLSLQGQGKENEICRWVYQPQEPSRYIAQKPMPVHMNLWLFKGLPPKNVQEIELVLRQFTFTPEPAPPVPAPK